MDAKRRCEEPLRTTISEHPGLGGLVLRPPRMDTGFSPTVRGVVDGLAVEAVAAAAVAGLGRVSAGRVEVLESFAPAAESSTADGAVLAVAATFTPDPLAPPTRWRSPSPRGAATSVSACVRCSRRSGKCSRSCSTPRAPPGPRGRDVRWC
ncbi:hypothetical protein V1227_10375 [Lentzea sp. DG1S-22]|uniref:hypothetical protein n=1 Tax=Lentzea sp. DG1S-22 TaxID=3108822 RepID=UPI002E77253A|nr:hypothetical protein [Lentzea sp. DG1S-22]WVH83127.1 hypothetical protein V1227_10375 [Lentzea sp. DG1S-22]